MAAQINGKYDLADYLTLKGVRSTLGPTDLPDYNRIRETAQQGCQSSLQQVIQNNQANAIRQQLKHDQDIRFDSFEEFTARYRSDGHMCTSGTITFNTNMKKVYEYVAYYAPTPEEAKANKGIDEGIILDGKLIADSEQTARTKVTRMIPDDYDTVIDKVKIEIRAFR